MIQWINESVRPHFISYPFMGLLGVIFYNSNSDSRAVTNQRFVVMHSF